MADQTKEFEKQLDLINEINKSIKSELDLREQVTAKVLAEQRALEKITEMETEAAASLRDELTLYEQRRVKQEELNKILKDDLTQIHDQIKIRETLFKLQEKGEEKDKEKAKKIIEEKKLSLEELDRLKKRFIQKQREYILDTQRLKSSQDAEKSIKGIGNWLGIVDEINDTWLGKLENSFKSTKSIAGALEGIAKGMANTFTPTKVFESTVSKVVESTLLVGKEMDTTLASFNRATGAGGKFNQTIDEVRFGSMEAGVGLKESAESVQALFENFTQFTQLSKETQVEVARTTAELDRMGISAKTTAQALDIGTKALGMNVSEALDAEKQIAATAMQLGVSPGKLADDFVASLPKLVQYGKQSTQIFKELATQSKATGISIEGLINISQQFDTFEGAAQAAGKLNAILGGNLLNSSELLAASESERIDMLRQSITASGRNFNELSKFEKMAIASAAGIKDMNEAARLFGTSSEEFEKVRQAQDAEALSTEALKNAASSATSVQEKMNLIMQAFSGAALPVLDIIVKIANGILALSDSLGGVLAPVLITITGSLYLMSKAFTLINGIKQTAILLSSLFSSSIVTETAATIIDTASKWAQVAATTALEVVTWLAAFAVEAFGVAVLIATSPVTLIVLGVLALIAAFVALIVYFDDISAWITDITGGFFDLWDIILIGLGPIGIMIELWRNWDNIVELFSGTLSSVGEVFNNIWNFFIEGFNSINAATKELSGGFLDVYDIMLILAGPFGWFIEIGKKIYENWEGIINGIKGLFQSLANTVSGIFDGIMDTIKAPINIGIETINSVISKANIIPGVEIPAVPALADGATNFMGGMALVGEQGPELVNIPQGANVISNENTNTLGAAGSALSKAKTEQSVRQTNAIERTADIKEKEQTTQGREQQLAGQPIILEIDGREFGRAVINVFDKKMKLNMVGA